MTETLYVATVYQRVLTAKKVGDFNKDLKYGFESKETASVIVNDKSLEFMELPTTYNNLQGFRIFAVKEEGMNTMFGKQILDQVSTWKKQRMKKYIDNL